MKIYTDTGALTSYGDIVSNNIQKLIDKIYDETVMAKGVDPQEIQTLIAFINNDCAEQAFLYNYDKGISTTQE